MDSNVPVVDLAAALDPNTLAAWIDYQLADHAVTVDGLIVRYDTFLTVTEGGIADDFICGHATDLAKALKGAEGAADKTRVKIKAPVLHAARLIDGAAKTITDKARSAATTIEGRVTTYLRAKEEQLRAAAEAEAAHLAAEARAAIATAEETNTETAIGAAVEAMDEASAAEAQATASSLDLTRTRGVGGAVTGLQARWTYRVVDITKVPAHLLMVNDTATKAYIKTGVREIAGLEIYNDPKAYAR